MEKEIEYLMQAFSFELYYGSKAIFVNCGGGAGLVTNTEVLKVLRRIMCCYSTKITMLFRKIFFGSIPYYYIKDGPRKIEAKYNNSITEKIVELSHDAYKKDYGIFVHRRLSVDLLKIV